MHKLSSFIGFTAIIIYVLSVLCLSVVHGSKLPRIKTEYARKSFMFMGAKVYNDLPLELRKIENNKEFEKQLKEHFR